MNGWNPAVFWPAMKAAGMLKTALVALPGCPERKSIDVSLSMPDVEMGNGQYSREYEIEYQHDDLPGLIEGVEMLIDGALYKTRGRPYIAGDDSASGFFRHVKLTRLAS